MNGLVHGCENTYFAKNLKVKNRSSRGNEALTSLEAFPPFRWSLVNRRGTGQALGCYIRPLQGRSEKS